jgi:D-aspartate ligase
MRPDVSIPVVVAGMHHGGLGIARTLGRWGVPVHGVDADPRAPGLRSRYLRGAHVRAWGEHTALETVDFLLRIAPAERALLIPTSDDLALLVAENADALGARYLFQRNPPELVRALSDKQALYHLCRTLGVPTPETAFPRSTAEVEAFAASAVFPVMLKGIDGLRLQRRTGVRMEVVHTPERLLERYAALEDPDSPHLMLQEYVPGGDDTVWMFNGYFDGRSVCRAGFTGKKLRQHPVHTGSTSLGICLENPEVHRLTVEMMGAIAYRGILDIGWRYDARDDGYKLLDPNPRIGSTFRLFADARGMDVARWLYLDLTGQPLPEPAEYQGRKWMIEDRDLESSLDYGREGALTLLEWMRSLRGVREAAWWARDDLRPFAIVAMRTLGRALAAVGRRLVPGRALPRPATPRGDPHPARAQAPADAAAA